MDYERSNFSLSQAYPEGNPRIFSIGPPANSTTPSPTSSPHSLSAGVYAGIGIGCATIILGVLLGLLAWRKKSGIIKSNSVAQNASSGERFDKAELVGAGKERVEAMEKERAELETVEQRLEVGGEQVQQEPMELDAGDIERRSGAECSS